MIGSCTFPLRGHNPYSRPRLEKDGEPSPSTIQRAGCVLAGAAIGTVTGAGSAIFALRHAPTVVGDFLATGFYEHRSGPYGDAPGHPVTDLLRDCANAALFVVAGVPMAGLIMAGGLVAIPLLSAFGGAYAATEMGLHPGEVARDTIELGRRYDGWWASSHQDFLRMRAEDKAYDAEHGRG